MAEERYCVNCRAELPRGVDACVQCGVYAGDVFEGRKRRGRGWIVAILAVIIIAAAAIWFRSPHPKQPIAEMPVRVVSDRPAGARRGPGAKLSEPEAIRTLRRQLTTDALKSECLVISSQGWRDGAYALTALNRCDGTRLGRWRVDANSGAVTRMDRSF